MQSPHSQVLKPSELKVKTLSFVKVDFGNIVLLIVSTVQVSSTGAVCRKGREGGGRRRH
jgi:hypothetical protein